jgi:hypothetical protein
MERRPGSVHRSAISCLSFCRAAQSTRLLPGQQTLAPAIVVHPGESVSISVRPREFQQLRVALIGKNYNELKLDVGEASLRGVFVKAILGIPGQSPSDPFISDDGESFVRIPILPAQDSQGSLNITILNESKSNLAPVPVDIQDVASPVSDESARRADALLAFAHAERLRREHKTADEYCPFMNEPLRQLRSCTI